MSKKTNVACSIACTLLLQSACATTQPMSSRIQPGTTQAEVLEIMGNPDKVVERCRAAWHCHRDFIYGSLNIVFERHEITGEYHVYGSEN